MTEFNNEHILRANEFHQKQKKQALEELEAAGLNPWFPLQTEEDWKHWHDGAG